jgi:hypothetical protein
MCSAGGRDKGPLPWLIPRLIVRCEDQKLEIASESTGQLVSAAHVDTASRAYVLPRDVLQEDAQVPNNKHVTILFQHSRKDRVVRPPVVAAYMLQAASAADIQAAGHTAPNLAAVRCTAATLHGPLRNWL